MKNTPGIYKEISIAVALGRVALGMVILLAGLVLLDVLVYLGVLGGNFDMEVNAAFRDGFNLGYAETYDEGYQEAHEKAYDKGYNKGYEISLALDSGEQTSNLVELRNLTYTELVEFLAADRTDSNEFVSGEYVCFDFAAELNNSAEASGIRAAYVRIRSKEWAHAVVAFETVDRGVIFIEPQSDMAVELTIGKPYPWWMTGASSPMRYTDVIEEIQIIW